MIEEEKGIREKLEQWQIHYEMDQEDIDWVRSLLGELEKWTRKHDDEDLQFLKEQANQMALAPKQAYINGLEHKVRHMETELEQEREKVRALAKCLADIKADTSIGKLVVEEE